MHEVELLVWYDGIGKGNGIVHSIETKKLCSSVWFDGITEGIEWFIPLKWKNED